MLEDISRANLSEAEAADEERVARIGAANAYAAGADSVSSLHALLRKCSYPKQTFSTLLSFFMAMAMYPEVQRKAQAELDAVIGPNRLPEHGDRESLPYVNAVAKEALRWQNAVPLGIVHRSMADDEYNGYFLPEGTLVFTNIWSVLTSSMWVDAVRTECDYSRQGRSCMTRRHTQTPMSSSRSVTSRMVS